MVEDPAKVVGVFLNDQGSVSEFAIEQEDHSVFKVRSSSGLTFPTHGPGSGIPTAHFIGGTSPILAPRRADTLLVDLSANPTVQPVLVYTCPSGAKAMLGDPPPFFYNVSGASVSLKAYLVPADETLDVVRHYIATDTASNNGFGQMYQLPSFLMEPGDKLYFTAPSTRITFTIFEYDEDFDSVVWLRPLDGLPAGDNLLYEVPEGLLVRANSWRSYNPTGASIAGKAKFALDGGAPITAQFSTNSAAAGGFGSHTLTNVPRLTGGDSVWMNTSAPGLVPFNLLFLYRLEK
jgi:hypothetical protein